MDHCSETRGLDSICLLAWLLVTLERLRAEAPPTGTTHLVIGFDAGRITRDEVCAVLSATRPLFPTLFIAAERRDADSWTLCVRAASDFAADADAIVAMRIAEYSDLRFLEGVDARASLLVYPLTVALCIAAALVLALRTATTRPLCLVTFTCGSPFPNSIFGVLVVFALSQRLAVPALFALGLGAKLDARRWSDDACRAHHVARVVEHYKRGAAKIERLGEVYITYQ